MSSERMNEKAPLEEKEEQELAQLLRNASGDPPPLEGSLLPNIQAHIRRQTRGRYFTGNRRTYRDPTVLLLGAATLLLIVAAALLGLFDSLLR